MIDVLTTQDEFNKRSAKVQNNLATVRHFDLARFGEPLRLPALANTFDESQTRRNLA